MVESVHVPVKCLTQEWIRESKQTNKKESPAEHIKSDNTKSIAVVVPLFSVAIIGVLAGTEHTKT